MYAMKEPIVDSPSDNRRKYRLCKSCVHAVKCTYAPYPERQVLFCDEFDGEALPSIRSVFRGDMSDLAQTVVTHAGADEETELLGLCRTCEHRKTCTYKKPAGGVWNCEEFD